MRMSGRRQLPWRDDSAQKGDFSTIKISAARRAPCNQKSIREERSALLMEKVKADRSFYASV